MHIIQSMKYFLCSCLLLSIVYNGFGSADHPHKVRKRLTVTEETSTNLGLGSEDKEELQDALQLLNMGKKALNLPTEDAQLLIQLVDASNSTDKSDEIQKFVEEPFDDHPSTNEKQYMALSGEEGRVNVDNYSVVTPVPEEASTNQNEDVQDVFKMVVRKKVPGSKDNAVHKITIIETNEIKTLPNMEALQSKRKKRVWLSRNSFYVPLARQKRTKDDPLLRFLKGEFSKQDVDEMFADKVSHAEHTIKIRDLVDGNRFGAKNSYLDKNKFSVNERGLINPFQQTYLPWIRPSRRRSYSQTNPKRREVFHAMKDTNNHRKQTVSLSNPTVWLKPSQYKDESNKYRNEDVDNIDYIFRNEVYKFSIPSISATEAQLFHKDAEIQTSRPKRRDILEETSMLNSKSNVFSQSPMTTSSATSKSEKNDNSLGAVKIYRLDKNRYSLEKSINPKEKNTTEATPTNVIEATTIVFIVLLCFSIIMLFYSSVFRRNNPQEPTLSLKGAHVTVNFANDDHQHPGQLPFRSHSSSFYTKLVDELEEVDGDELADLEWQSETGEWISDKGSVRNAIGFEKL